MKNLELFVGIFTKVNGRNFIKSCQNYLVKGIKKRETKNVMSPGWGAGWEGVPTLVLLKSVNRSMGNKNDDRTRYIHYK